MNFQNDWAVIVPMANEENEFHSFIEILKAELNKLASGKVYLIVDNVSKDNTLNLCQELSNKDNRFITVYAPENKNVVDAYLKGYRTAFENGHEFIIEMDAGLSHDPKALPLFLKAFQEGNECVFGSRFIEGGQIEGSSFNRWFLSKAGTVLANLLLGTSLKDMTSGYQGFNRELVKKLIEYPIKSKAHFIQTEERYLMRRRKFVEVPIRYRAPSPSVSGKAILNSISTLVYYFLERLKFKKHVL